MLDADAARALGLLYVESNPEGLGTLVPLVKGLIEVGLQVAYGVKRCTSCGQERGLHRFSASSANPDGRQAWCRGCFRSRRQVSRAR